MTDQPSVLYVYGFVRSGFDLTRAPAGVEDAPVALIPDGPFAALISRLPEQEYSAEPIERRSADVSWLSARAKSHDLVLTWAQEHGGVLPLPMFSLWASEATLRETLSRKRADLASTFERVDGADEFGVRMHRREARMLESVERLDDDIARLKAEADASSPGQRYLIERKLADQKKAAIRRASQQLSREAFERLTAVSRDSLSRPLAPGSTPDTDATLVLNGAFLVDRARTNAFRAELTALMTEQQPLGLLFDFTGPWPPYHFVGSDAALRGSTS